MRRAFRRKDTWPLAGFVFPSAGPRQPEFSIALRDKLEGKGIMRVDHKGSVF
jgi:hypothetical protein